MDPSCFINSVESLEEVSDQKLPEKDFVPLGLIGTQKFLLGMGLTLTLYIIQLSFQEQCYKIML
jgi:hypothetical protein